MVSNLELLGKEFKYITPLHGFQSLKSSNLMMKALKKKMIQSFSKNGQ
jgi:hypothetical protein